MSIFLNVCIFHRLNDQSISRENNLHCQLQSEACLIYNQRPELIDQEEDL